MHVHNVQEYLPLFLMNGVTGMRDLFGSVYRQQARK
jgi:hypothetical protein